ncbi:MAG: hypothetical protein O2798_02775 [Chloroflexi bacterium]|nr:hypothetical protein [Chloroflexota bacterium]MDA1239748.1 hypothetical protein [Chloroflexota bacterium]MQC25780.1 hypothetical protein [Chloroflexota bacterium]
MATTTTKHKKTEDAPVLRTAPKCVHHWLIETPNGRESHGYCKRCGETKAFTNSTEQVMWEQSNSLRNDLSRNAFRSSKLDEVSLADEA